jgi:FkbM family methyltransferase
MKRLFRIAYALARLPFSALRRVLLFVMAQIVRLLPTRFWLDLRNRHSIIRKIDYRGGDVPIQVESRTEYDLRLRSASREPETVGWIEAYFNKGDVFYDIGANVGAYALIAHRFCGGDIKAYAFEPAFMTFPQLCRNIQLNGAGEAIMPFQVALANQTSMAPFNYYNLDPGSALHALGSAIDWRGRPFEPVLSHYMMSYRLDDLIAQFDLLSPNHIKIDVDGIENEVLLGARKTLKEPALETVLIETYDGREFASDIVSLLRESGFELVWREHDNFLYARSKVVKDESSE